MPYIVTTKRLEGFTVEETGSRWSTAELGEAHHKILSRRAVATLDEARDVIEGHGYDWYLGGADRPSLDWLDPLSESGGTVGPLPDGTLIDVASVAYEEVASAAGVLADYYLEMSDRGVIDTFNAREKAA